MIARAEYWILRRTGRRVSLSHAVIGGLLAAGFFAAALLAHRWALQPAETFLAWVLFVIAFAFAAVALSTLFGKTNQTNNGGSQ